MDTLGSGTSSRVTVVTDREVRKTGISSQTPGVLKVLFSRELAFTCPLFVDAQVILMLTADLDGEDEKDKGALDNLLSQLIAELGMDKKVKSKSYCVKNRGRLRPVLHFYSSFRDCPPVSGGALHEGCSSVDSAKQFSVPAAAQAYSWVRA